MNVQEVQAKLSSLQHSLRELHVKSLSLFGSTARGENGPDSDLDFMVEFDGPASFDRFMDLKDLLEAQFETPVDLVTQRSLKQRLRAEVLKEAIPVA